jgi:hypothetical protein
VASLEHLQVKACENTQRSVSQADVEGLSESIGDYVEAHSSVHPYSTNPGWQKESGLLTSSVPITFSGPALRYQWHHEQFDSALTADNSE